MVSRAHAVEALNEYLAITPLQNSMSFVLCQIFVRCHLSLIVNATLSLALINVLALPHVHVASIALKIQTQPDLYHVPLRE